MGEIGFMVLLACLIIIFTECRCYKLQISLHHEERFVVEDTYDSEKERESWNFLQHQLQMQLSEQNVGPSADQSRLKRDANEDSFDIGEEFNSHVAKSKGDISDHKVSGGASSYVQQVKLAKKRFVEKYDIFIVMATCAACTLLSMFCSYWCCFKGGSCGCLKRTGRKAGQRAAENYMAGLRKDSQGNFFYDELTQEEKEALGMAQDEFNAFE